MGELSRLKTFVFRYLSRVTRQKRFVRPLHRTIQEACDYAGNTVRHPPWKPRRHHFERRSMLR